MQRSDEQFAAEMVQAAPAVHAALGPGFVESVYSKAFSLELRQRGFAVEREKLIRVTYESCVVGRHYLDLVVEGRAIVELKAVRSLVPVFEAQMSSYLAATQYAFGLIINFGSVELDWKQIINAFLLNKTN